MTQTELDVIPEIGGFGQREEIREGVRVCIPVLMTPRVVVWDAHFCIDSNGYRWMIGEHEGKKVKQRCYSI